MAGSTELDYPFKDVLLVLAVSYLSILNIINSRPLDGALSRHIYL